MPAFVAHPEGGPFPVAVLYMDAIGYREQIKENARRFAQSGFFVVAPDLFYRAGEGLAFDMARIVEERYDGPEWRRLQSATATVTPDRAVDDTRELLNVTSADPAARAGARVCVGYCMGARMALHLAAEMGDQVVAVAGIHPGRPYLDGPDSPHLDLPKVNAEVFFAFAGIDRTVTPEIVERFRKDVEESGVRGEIEQWPGVAHGFSMADLPVYDRDAAERHFERTLDLWRRNLN